MKKEDEKKKEKRTVYLDHAATTPLDPDVYAVMLPHLQETFGNPSSLHHAGREAKQVLEHARNDIAHTLGVLSNEIIFTSSGTESANLAILGVAKAYQSEGKHIIVSSIEHKAVLEAAANLESQGFVITYLPTDHSGCINVEECIRAIRPDTILISIMYANNEIGTVEPIPELAKRVHSLRRTAYTPLLHTDACQAVGMLPINIPELGVDLMTCNSSKIYGPKGIGLLYTRHGVKIAPRIVGGDQERGMRAGTENVPLAVGFAKAIEKSFLYQEKYSNNLNVLKKYFIEALKNSIPDIVINGPTKERLPNNVHISIPHIEGESLLLLLDEQGICCSTGSACSTRDLSPSHVLRAIGLSDELIHGSLRFTLGHDTTKEDLDYTVSALARSRQTLRSITAPSLLKAQLIAK